MNEIDDGLWGHTDLSSLKFATCLIFFSIDLILICPQNLSITYKVQFCAFDNSFCKIGNIISIVKTHSPNKSTQF